MAKFPAGGGWPFSSGSPCRFPLLALAEKPTRRGVLRAKRESGAKQEQSTASGERHRTTTKVRQRGEKAVREGSRERNPRACVRSRATPTPTPRPRLWSSSKMEGRPGALRGWGEGRPLLEGSGVGGGGGLRARFPSLRGAGLVLWEAHVGRTAPQGVVRGSFGAVSSSQSDLGSGLGFSPTKNDRWSSSIWSFVPS